MLPVRAPYEICTVANRYVSNVRGFSPISTLGRLLSNAGLEKIALHVLTRMLPQLGRVQQPIDVTSGKTDLAQLIGANLGVQSTLRTKMAIAWDYSQSKSAFLKQNPQAVKDPFISDPHAAGISRSVLTLSLWFR